MKKWMWMVLVLLLACTMTLSAAAANDTYIRDEADLLTDSQERRLNALADAFTRKHEAGIYIVTTDDYRDYDYQITDHGYPIEGDVFDYTYTYYHENQLGYGRKREGMILLMSMDQREYAIFFYGDRTNNAFGDYAQIQLENKFLDDFRGNVWYDGMEDYLESADAYFTKAESGRPVKKIPWVGIVVVVVIVLLIAAGCTTLEIQKLNNVSLKRNAAHYAGNLNLTDQREQFLYQTRTKTRISSSSGSGSGSRSRSGGGGRGRSGRF